MLDFIFKLSKFIWVIILLVILFPRTEEDWNGLGLSLAVAASVLLLLLLGIQIYNKIEERRRRVKSASKALNELSVSNIVADIEVDQESAQAEVEEDEEDALSDDVEYPEIFVSVADEIEKFASLRDRGIITENEFLEQKRKLLNR